jgi:hypothetical protein
MKFILEINIPSARAFPVVRVSGPEKRARFSMGVLSAQPQRLSSKRMGNCDRPSVVSPNTFVTANLGVKNELSIKFGYTG